MKNEHDQLRIELRRLCAQIISNRAKEIGEDEIEEWCFHILDVFDDIQKFAKLLRDMEEYKYEERIEILNDIMIHTVPHLMAAALIGRGEISDPFDIFKKLRNGDG